jgi:hypothetical protein
MHWIQTLVCSKPLPRPRGRWDWDKILDDGSIQIWVCKQDLKESFVREAKLAFGKCLEQVIRLGNHTQILYPEISNEQ